MMSLDVLKGVEIRGHINTDEATLAAQVAHSIRLGHPQVKGQPVQPDRICLIGGGPSLAETEGELRDLYYAGAKIVTVNGAYHWCLERNYRPSMQIVLDARAVNARFVEPPVPRCQYLLASQCHPDTWAKVQGREGIWIWHAAAADSPHKAVLDAYYLGNWQPSSGGTTVVMRAILLLRMLGFIRMDLFGVDSCVKGTEHHAYPQPENDADRVRPVDVWATGNPEQRHTFYCTTWHIKQLECFLQLIRLHGEHVLLRVHGDGLLACALALGAAVETQEQE